MPKLYFLFFFLTIIKAAFAQDSTSNNLLDTAIVKAYGNDRAVNIAASIAKLNPERANIGDGTSFLLGINSRSGVRMEQRSPGSYRLNIRGSSVRSPYGVRNVKIYYDGIPFTSPGGSSFFNMFSLTQTNSLHILKSPGNSIYGAGTGGVLLLNKPEREYRSNLGVVAGSNGLININSATSLQAHSIGLDYLTSQGWRNHSQIKRAGFIYTGDIASKKEQKLKALLLYSFVNYETPGGLTLAEYNFNPKAARPATANAPGAEEAKAGIEQQSLFAALKYESRISKNTINESSIHYFIGSVASPAIRNYEDKNQPHTGIRTEFQTKINNGLLQLKAIYGLEAQAGWLKSETFENISGQKGPAIGKYDLAVQQGFAFGQLNAFYQRFIATLGAGLHYVHYNFQEASRSSKRVSYKNILTPRFSLLYKIDNNLSLYSNISKGFSPPATEEIFSDNEVFNQWLLPEKSTTVEIGLKGNITKNLLIDLTLFNSGIKNTVVTRRDSLGSNYYVNAGKTKQPGIEFSVDFFIEMKAGTFIQKIQLSNSITYHPFKYKNFFREADNFSGNYLPGIPKHYYSTILQILFVENIYLNTVFNQSAAVYLNDANSSVAPKFSTVNLKTGFSKHYKKTHFEVYFGINNLTGEIYSLGNDINAFGGRFYNAAPGREFYGGVKVSL